ncbi:MAG: hypothetical protein A2X64_04140 [Ignavibacteria bacterium GWF2_33_9]|nr:MAG: hypothetical protein A2X64_04140 [Ignavibacteria bacterium GWF2_33_9]
MELWDAETLTKIKDFGEVKVGGFQDIQISNDNLFIGCIGDNRTLNILEKNSEFLLKRYENTSAFTFSLDNQTILVYSFTNSKDKQSNVISLDSFDTLYQFHKFGSFFRINKEKQIFTIGYEPSLGSKMVLLSNRWDSIISVNKPASANGFNQISYYNNSINIKLENIEFIDELFVIDILGKKLFTMSEITPVNNEVSIPLVLPSGNYLIKIVSSGKEYSSKFIVTR